MSRIAALALALVLAAGCGTIPPTGPVTSPEIYPDRTTPQQAFHSFLWAWHEGDVETLGRVLGGYLRHELNQRIDEDGLEAAAAWCARTPASSASTTWSGSISARGRPGSRSC